MILETREMRYFVVLSRPDRPSRQTGISADNSLHMLRDPQTIRVMPYATQNGLIGDTLLIETNTSSSMIKDHLRLQFITEIAVNSY